MFPTVIASREENIWREKRKSLVSDNSREHEKERQRTKNKGD